MLVPFSAGHIGAVTSVPSGRGGVLLVSFLRPGDSGVHLAPLSAGKLSTVTFVPGGGNQEYVILNVPLRGVSVCVLICGGTMGSLVIF